MKKILIILIISISLCSCSATKNATSILDKSTSAFNNAYVNVKYNICSLFNIYPCHSSGSSESSFRASASYACVDKQIAEERSLSNAKMVIQREIDNYILKKWGHNLFLASPNYEIYVEQIKNEMLNNTDLVCSKVLFKRNMYYSYVSLEIDKNNVDEELSKKFELKKN